VAARVKPKSPPYRGAAARQNEVGLTGSAYRHGLRASEVCFEKAAAGDMQAIKELADRLDGKPAQFLEHSGPDSEPILGMEAADPILKIKTAAVNAAAGWARHSLRSQ